MLAIIIHCFEIMLAITELLKMRSETKAIHTWLLYKYLSNSDFLISMKAKFSEFIVSSIVSNPNT